MLAGLGLIGSAALIPAIEALEEARYVRDVALAAETHRLERIERYEAFISALDARDPSLFEDLRVLHLNQYPEGFRPLGELAEDPALASASVFEKLETAPPVMPEEPAHRAERSMLARLATASPHRLWLIAAGGVCVLIGVLPASTTRARKRRGASAQKRRSSPTVLA